MTTVPFDIPAALAGPAIAILRPMLADYPTIPDGYDGWYTFQPRR